MQGEFFAPAAAMPALPELYARQMGLTRLPGNMPVAMAYVPMQEAPEMYTADVGFETGTMFPELNKPFTGKRGVLR